MNSPLDIVRATARGLLARFGDDCGLNLERVAEQIGLSIEEVEADNFDGALLRIKGVPRGTVVLNRSVREPGRKRFTLAHEIGHYLLPNQQDCAGPCSKGDIGQWSSRLP